MERSVFAKDSMRSTYDEGRASIGRGSNEVRFLTWDHHIEGLDRISDFGPQERNDAKRALLYLRGKLGTDFLERGNAGSACVARHALLRMLANFAASSRRSIARFAEQLRSLEGSENVGNVLARLHDTKQFDHDALLIKAASRLVRQGLRVRFEPTMEVKNHQKQPDLRLESPLTGETAFLEVTTQTTSEAEKAITDVNSAVFAAVFGESYDLCVSGRWWRTPEKAELEQILKRIECGSARVLRKGTIVTILENGLAEMALCQKSDQTRLLEPWCAEKGLSVGGFVGPVMQSKDTVRIKRKIRVEQEQLQHGRPNVLLILATDAFFRAGGVRRVAREVEEGMLAHEQVNLVILHGEYVGTEETPFAGQIGEHKYTRKVVDGSAEVDLLLYNAQAPSKLSPALLGNFLRSF